MLGIIAVCVLVGICAFMVCRAWLVESRAHPLPPAYQGTQVGADEIQSNLWVEVQGLLPINCSCIFAAHRHNKVIVSEAWQFVKKVFEHSIQHDGVTYIKLGPKIFYCVADPDDALVVANTCLGKSFIYGFAKYWLGEGLITGAGDHWHRHRQMLKPSFSLPIINGYLEVFNSQSKSLLGALEIYVGKGKIDPLLLLRQSTLASSFLTTFGKSANDDKLYPKYVKATNEMLYLLMRRIQKFWLHSDLLHTLLGHKKHKSELVKTVDEISDKMIQTTKLAISTRILSSYVSYEPLLAQMLQLPGKNRFTDQEIREKLHTTIVAAYDTTAISLQYALVLIGSYPKVQERMYEEIMHVVGSDRDINRDDIRKLVYIEAVIKESMRLIPTVPVTLRYLDTDVKLSKTYAMTSMKVTLAHILRNYVITADYSTMQFQMYLTLKPVSGNEISLERRTVPLKFKKA